MDLVWKISTKNLGISPSIIAQDNAPLKLDGLARQQMGSIKQWGCCYAGAQEWFGSPRIHRKHHDLRVDLGGIRFWDKAIWRFPKSWGYRKIIHFNRMFHKKPTDFVLFWSILGIHHLWKPHMLLELSFSATGMPQSRQLRMLWAEVPSSPHSFCPPPSFRWDRAQRLASSDDRNSSKVRNPDLQLFVPLNITSCHRLCGAFPPGVSGKVPGQGALTVAIVVSPIRNTPFWVRFLMPHVGNLGKWHVAQFHYWVLHCGIWFCHDHIMSQSLDPRRWPTILHIWNQLKHIDPQNWKEL